MQIVVADARVQGNETEKTVLRALDCLEALAAPLVVIIRGGGSRVDLSHLDNEAIARRIAAYPVPVWTVAALSAPCPTAGRSWSPDPSQQCYRRMRSQLAGSPGASGMRDGSAMARPASTIAPRPSRTIDAAQRSRRHAERVDAGTSGEAATAHAQRIRPGREAVPRRVHSPRRGCARTGASAGPRAA